MANKHIIIFAVLVFAISMLYAVHMTRSRVTPKMAVGNVQDFNKNVLQSKKPVLVDFWAAWCGPCREMSPVVDEISKKYSDKLTVYKVNVDDNRAIAAQYKVSSIPTLIIFKQGKPIDRQEGFTSREDVIQRVTSRINN